MATRRGTTKRPAEKLDPAEVRFRLKMAADALAARGATKRRMEEAQRVLRRLKRSDLPEGEPRDRYLWLQRALAQYEAGEAVSATAMTWIRQQMAELRELLSCSGKKQV
jgi:hypothetical protein